MKQSNRHSIDNRKDFFLPSDCDGEVLSAGHSPTSSGMGHLCPRNKEAHLLNR